MKPTMFTLLVALLSTPIVASGGGFTLVVKADGTVVGWGCNDNSQSAQPDAPRGSVASPIVIDLPGEVLQVAMSDLSQYALLEDGSVVAWGQNDEGQLGNGPMGATGELGRYPKPSIAPVRVTGLKDIIQVEAGAKHALAVKRRHGVGVGHTGRRRDW